MQSLLRLTGMLASAGMMTACAALPQRSEPVRLDASLTQPCRVLAPPTDGRRGASRRWAEEAALLLRECADRQARLVEAVSGGAKP